MKSSWMFAKIAHTLKTINECRNTLYEGKMFG